MWEASRLFVGGQWPSWGLSGLDMRSPGLQGTQGRGVTTTRL